MKPLPAQLVPTATFLCVAPCGKRASILFKATFKVLEPLY